MNDPDVEHGQEGAIEAYLKATGRTYVQGDLVEIPTDALVFTTYQKVWPTIDTYIADRCKYDPETNQWLEWYVEEHMLESYIPPVYVDILSDGVALVDGCHRVSAHLIDGRTTILAYLNAL